MLSFKIPHATIKFLLAVTKGSHCPNFKDHRPATKIHMHIPNSLHATTTNIPMPKQKVPACHNKILHTKTSKILYVATKDAPCHSTNILQLQRSHVTTQKFLVTQQRSHIATKIPITQVLKRSLKLQLKIFLILQLKRSYF